VYDEAGLLSQEEYDRLNLMANEYGAKRETDIVIYTSNNTESMDVMKMTQDFYDEHAPGYDKSHGNAVILTMDMKNREIYLAGFYKAKEYLDDGRLDKIRNKITPYLTSGDYELAFEKYIKTAHKYMGFRPGANPDNILFNGWFQLAVSLGIAGIIVGLMAYHSGGRVTVDRRTYEDAGTSGILEQQDQYIRTTVTKRKIEKSSGGGSGGGGGTSGGGHSHSGSRGSF
ncbi:MAG: TPM domain-containing protein, partial [Gorillibacterium sp.]|nr:TPM domain-containing protein [Gorillibacterium sp.]